MSTWRSASQILSYFPLSLCSLERERIIHYGTRGTLDAVGSCLELRKTETTPDITSQHPPDGLGDDSNAVSVRRCHSEVFDNVQDAFC
jgi:hypothetical protein